MFEVEGLIKKARTARFFAYALYSKFSVGAAVLGVDWTGKLDIYTGCNVENASYGLTMCAERVAIFNAVSNGCTSIKELAVCTDLLNPAYPCGACRQVMAQFKGLIDPIIYLVNNDESQRPITTTLNTLLPHTFNS